MSRTLVACHSTMRGPVWSTMPRSSRPVTLRSTRPPRRTARARPRTARSWSAPSSSRTPTCRWCAASAAPLSVVVTGGAGQIAGPAGLCAQARRWPSPGWRSRCATSTTWPATRGGWWPRSTPRASRARWPRTSRCTSSSPTSATTASLARRGGRGGRRRAAAQVPHRRAGGRGVPGRARSGPLDRRGAGPRDAVQVHGRPAQRRPAHRRGRLRAPRLRQRAGRDPAGLRRCRAGRGGRGAGAARRRGAGGRGRRELDLAGARRWFTSFGSCSVAEPLADLRELRGSSA